MAVITTAKTVTGDVKPVVVDTNLRMEALVKNIGPLNTTFGLPTPRVADKKPRSLLKGK